MTRADVIKLLRKEMKSRGMSQNKYSAHIGLSPQYFGRVLNGTRVPGPGVLKVLGLKRTVKRIETFSPIETAEAIPLSSRSTHGTL